MGAENKFRKIHIDKSESFVSFSQEVGTFPRKFAAGLRAIKNEIMPHDINFVQQKPKIYFFWLKIMD